MILMSFQADQAAVPYKSPNLQMYFPLEKIPDLETHVLEVLDSLNWWHLMKTTCGAAAM